MHRDVTMTQYDSEFAGSPPRGTFVEVGGRRLAHYRSGGGTPSVVFLPGGGAVGLDYLNVLERVAELTTGVLYDRAGTGWSDSVGLPRSSTAVTDELRELLRVAGAPAPYLLVGHSLGGLYARHYAIRFPDEVAGLLLLDPAHEDYDAYMPKALTELRRSNRFFRLMNVVMAAALRTALTRGLLLRLPVVKRYRELYRALFAKEMSTWPQDVRRELVERHVSLDWLGVGLREASDIDRLYDEVRRAGPMPDVPLIVLCSTGTDGFRDAVSSGESESMLRDEIEGKRRLYADLTNSVRRGEIRLVDAGHFTMHFRHPEAVLQGIQDLIGISAGEPRSVGSEVSVEQGSSTNRP
jgi:pimeloyl-ACP methyl ester carboxylesterase